MKKYDVIVVGSGAGSAIVDQALADGLKVALVDRGPLGGTCLNVGCIPSKMLIFPADRIIEIQEASKLGIKAEIQEVVDAMATTGTILPLINGIHIHPALPEVIVDTLRNLKEMDQMNSDQSPTDGF